MSARLAASTVSLSVGCGLCCRASLLETRAQATQRTITNSTGQRELKTSLVQELVARKHKARKVVHFELSGYLLFNYDRDISIFLIG